MMIWLKFDLLTLFIIVHTQVLHILGPGQSIDDLADIFDVITSVVGMRPKKVLL